MLSRTARFWPTISSFFSAIFMASSTWERSSRGETRVRAYAVGATAAEVLILIDCKQTGAHDFGGAVITCQLEDS